MDPLVRLQMEAFSAALAELGQPLSIIIVAGEEGFAMVSNGLEAEMVKFILNKAAETLSSSVEKTGRIPH